MLRALMLVALTGCRFRFLDTGGGSGSDARSDDAVTNPDSSDAADPCLGGDNVCLPACVATDPDCTTTCGDNRCVGNAGELCGNCAADCAQLAIVCGNGECQAGEDGDTCPADCGPTVWPWTADETALLNAVNAARTGGVMCPGETMTRTAPALTIDLTMQPGAREYAWEIAHHQYYMPAGTSCNGRTFSQRIAVHGADSGMSSSSTSAATTAMQVVDGWKMNVNLCAPALMTTSNTTIATGVAHDAKHGWVAWFK